MTTEDEISNLKSPISNSPDMEDLREMQAELVATEESPWQPRCVGRAFCSDAVAGEFVFSMQVWIDLDAMQSPFLLGEIPEVEVAWVEFEKAFRAFGYFGTTPEACDPEGLVLIGRKMIGVIAEGFAMRVPLDVPEGSSAVKVAANGFGDWLPLLTCLKSQMGFGWAEALELPVGQVYALIAAHRCNEGWSVSGETYALRDVEEEDSHAEARRLGEEEDVEVGENLGGDES